MKDFLKQIVQAGSTVEQGEFEVASLISQELARYGIESHIDTWDDNRANLFATVKFGGSGSALLFLCHLDVVPPGTIGWNSPPFEAVESNGRIYGRGSTDMKGGITAIVEAIRNVVDAGTKLKGDIILVATAGEETDSCGARRFMSNSSDRLGPLAGVVIPEPTDFDIVIAHRGMLWLEITTKGKTAHGSTPHLGVNAITSMQSVLDELDGYEIQAEPHEVLGPCSMSINTITGGEAINVVPDTCRLGIDIRTLPGQDHEEIITDIKQMLSKLEQADPQFQADVSIVRQVDALQSDVDSNFVTDFCSAVDINETTAVGFTTDGPHFASLNVPIVIFGPGKPELCHKPDEYIELSDVEQAVEYYKKIILKFLG
jgi:succinyl-diaminopimelate desuccinylase